MLTLVGKLQKQPKAIVVNTEQFEPDLFAALIPDGCTGGIMDLTITTVDLLGVIRRLEQETNTEFHCSTWITVNSLRVLAQKGFCELVYHIHDKDLSEYYNLTKTNNPYWSLELYLNPVRDRYFTEPFIYWDEKYKDKPHRELYVRPISDAYNNLLEYPLDKIWYTESKRTREEDREWTSKRVKLKEKAFEWMKSGVIINDGTQVIEFD